MPAIIPRGFGGIRTTEFSNPLAIVEDYTERIWRYQDNMNSLAFATAWDYTERIWRYQDNDYFVTTDDVKDYTERIWRYQDNSIYGMVIIRLDYTERIWRLSGQPLLQAYPACFWIIPRGFGGIRTTTVI